MMKDFVCVKDSYGAEMLHLQSYPSHISIETEQ